jgi:hypothetical protein
MNRSHLCRTLTLLVLASSANAAQAYEADIHQQLTFIAARQFNQCAQASEEVARLSALDTRYVVKSNVAQADGNFFVRMFRWRYYNRADQTNKSMLGLIETRFHEHFAALVDAVEEDHERDARLRALGRVMNYVQAVTSPAYVVPVYAGRWWRFSMSDRFNRFPLDAQRVERAVSDSCEVIAGDSRNSYGAILNETASDTLRAVRSPIFGFPSTWEAYWSFAKDPADFGEYGAAGNNFGERAEFRCGVRALGTRQWCLLLKDDPLYQDFAFERHVAAAIASMRIFAVLQSTRADGENEKTLPRLETAQ